MKKIKTTIIALLTLINVIYSCTTMPINESKKPKDVHEKAVWLPSVNRWGYKDEIGKETFWYPSGKISQTDMTLNNKLEGFFIMWYENGTKKTECIFKNGIENGLMQGWWLNGTLALKGNYINGKKDGLWETFDEKGNKLGEAIYKDGVKISEKDFTK